MLGVLPYLHLYTLLALHFGMELGYILRRKDSLEIQATEDLPVDMADAAVCTGERDTNGRQR